MAKTKDVAAAVVCLDHPVCQHANEGGAKKSYCIYSSRIDTLTAPLDDFFSVVVDCGSVLRDEVF